MIAAFLLFWAAPALAVKNFGMVNEHLYRGAEPRLLALPQLARLGVTFIIDLREPGAGTAAEQAVAARLGMRYVNTPLSAFGTPPRTNVDAVLKLLQDNSSRTVFVHCRRGKDRTGMVVACYRIAHDGWDYRQALQEADAYGMSRAERGMRRFVREFVPLNSKSSELKHLMSPFVAASSGKRAHL